MGSSNVENILYELFIYAEWKPDPDFVRGDVVNKTHSGLPLNLLGLFKPELTLIDHLSSYVDQLQPWQICLGDDGKVVAILQDTILEIRSKRGNFSNMVAKSGVPKDPNPQWRKMAWSPDCSLLAIAYSNGKVSFYDLLGINVFNISADDLQFPDLPITDTTYAIAGIIFLTNRVVDQKWSSELLLVDYRGELRSYFVSPTDFKPNHSFNFGGGISTVTYHENHNMLFVTGLSPTMGQEPTTSSDFGLKGWRLLNDSPFYKLSVDYNKQKSLTYSSWLLSYLSFWRKSKQSIITKSIASPNGSLLACLHTDGIVSIWQLPILKVTNVWNLISQPDFDAPSPLASNIKQKGWPALKNHFSEYSPIDINWWGNEAIIVSRLNGSVSICSLLDLHNMLGDNPVFLQGHPQISNTFDNGFLSLECESILISAKKLRRKSDIDNDSVSILKDLSENESYDDSEDEKVSLVSRSTEILKAALYIITDMERFQPKPKKLNLLSRIYRLLCLKSTTPEDLYLRKIENAAYEEALGLAESYNLDSDLVFQQQWRSSKVSSQSIKEYLAKVTKKIWIIQQCCDRVPESLDAAKELLEFGLKLTNKEIFKGLKSKIDKKVFYEKGLWDKIELEELSAQSTEILRYRYTMLFYLDRLEIYKAIIRSEKSNYSSEEYNRLRSNTICQSAIEFAKEGRIEALISLWPHLDNLALRLLILQNIPETLDPLRYKSLLPGYEDQGLLSHPKIIKRSTDWCEKEKFQSIWSSIGIDDLCFEDTIDGVMLKPPSTNLSEWYSNRAREIEKFCGLCCHSLMLIKLALDKNVPGLDELHALLITLDILLYDINIEPLTLEQLEKCSQNQISNYLMSKTSHDTIIDDMKLLLLPYLDRCEKLSSVPTLKESLLKEYITDLCKKDLTIVLVVILGANTLGFSVQQCLDLADHCYMIQDTCDNLTTCFDILDALPEVSDHSTTPSNLVKVLDEMNKLLNACNLLENYDVPLTYRELKSLIGKQKEVQELLIRLSRSSTKKRYSSSDWNSLLNDIQSLHSYMFCDTNNELCHEIFAASLISSGNKASIMSAEQVLTCQANNGINSMNDQRTIPNKSKLPFKLSVSYKVPFQKSILIVLEAAREYYNSASSLNDPSLEHSWTCLQLIKEDNVEIQLERDLISALKILNDFELTILPVQVRLYPSKIEFIEECLNCNERAYKSVDKVLQLAKLLRVAGDDDKKREIVVVSLCAVKSLDAEDYEEAKKLGKNLVTISEGSSAANSVVAAHRLGAESSLSDLSLRHQLLNLALLYCEPQHIENLLQIRSTVESEILQTEINNLVNMTSNLNPRHINLQDSMESTEDDYLDALTSPIVENKGITAVQAVEKYIQKPLSVLGDKKNWKNALNFSWGSDPKSTNTSSQYKNSGKLACHTFYSHLHEDCHVSLFATQYDKFSPPDVFDPQLVMLHSVIRNSMLQDCIKYGSPPMAHVETFVQCAEYTVMEDTAYCISQLLSVCHSPDFDKHIKNVDLDIKTVHSVLYFYALMNYIILNTSPDEGFFKSPIILVSDVLKKIQSIEHDDITEPIKGLIYCRNIMDQLIEGKKLVKLGCDVNIELFAQDSTYRKNAILNLAKTSNNEIFQLAIELAKKYSIKEQDLIFNYVTFIILNHGVLNSMDCMNILSDTSLIDKLAEDSPTLLERLEKNVFKNLDGRDHQGLILYFNLLSNINNRHVMNGLNPKEHIKFIKKAKSACSGIDYKYLLEIPSQKGLFDSMISVLTKDNIGFVTKLLRNLPPCLNFQFNSSNFYREWLIHFFFNVPENIQSSKKWMQQHRECSSYFSKVNKDDMLLFTTHVLFSDAALQKLPSSTRIQIAIQTGEYCLHEHQNNEHFNINTKNSDDSLSWDDVSAEITRWGKFLECFHSEKSKNIIMNAEKVPPEIWTEIESSQGKKSLLLLPLTKLALDNNFSTKSLKTFLNALDNEVKINDILLNILNNHEINSSTLSTITKYLMELKTDIISIDDELLEKMKVYTTSTLLSSKQRLDLMSLYQTQSNFDDTEMLEKISIEMITNIWGQDVINSFEEINMADSFNRRDILIKLMNIDIDWEKLKALVDLINMWPPHLEEEEKNKMPHLLLSIKLLDNDDNLDDNIPLFKLLLSKQQISDNDVTWILSNNLIGNVFGKLWLCVLSANENVYNNTLPVVALDIKDEKIMEKHLNDAFLSEIFNRKLFTNVIRSKLYPKLVQNLFRENTSGNSASDVNYTLDMAIHDLLQKNYFAEAGALKMTAVGFPHTLRTFTQSLMLRKS